MELSPASIADGKSKLQLLRSLNAQGDAKVNQSVGMAVGRYRHPPGVMKAACSLQENRY